MKRSERLNDPENSLREAMAGNQSRIWTSIPGIVNSVDLDAQTLSVQPAIQGIIFDKEGNSNNQTLPLLINVPIVWPRAGGFALTFPIEVGDEVLVIFSSRSIDSWWQSGGVQAQVERRMHDLSDGFAVLAPTSQPNKMTNVSSTNVQLRNETGNSFVEITPSGAVNIQSSSEINVKSTGQVNVEGSQVELKASTTATITSPAIVLNGTVTGGQGGGMSLGPGGLTSTGAGGLTIDGEPYEQHKHSGVQSGPSITGPVV